MSDCQWERYKATAAPMASQQRAIKLCSCAFCTRARNYVDLQLDAKLKNPRTIERAKVLAWKPEPPADEVETDVA